MTKTIVRMAVLTTLALGLGSTANAQDLVQLQPDDGWAVEGYVFYTRGENEHRDPFWRRLDTFDTEQEAEEFMALLYAYEANPDKLWSLESLFRLPLEMNFVPPVRLRVRPLYSMQQLEATFETYKPRRFKSPFMPPERPSY